MNSYKSYLITGFIIFAIGAGIVTGLSLLYSFLAAIAFSILVLSRKGHIIWDLLGMAGAGVWEYRDLYILILLIGANISVWMSSGVVPAVMYYGFDYLRGTNFILVAFLLTGVMSVFMGTAVGTISTLGIALLGIGRGFDLPPGLLLGVLVSGAYIADKVSPISGLLNLTLRVTGTSYRQVIWSMAKTLVPVVTMTAVAYYYLGNVYAVAEKGQQIQYYQQAIWNSFVISPWLLLLPLLVVALPLKGIKIIPTIVIGLVGGGLVTWLLQGAAPMAVLNYVVKGYRGGTGSADLDSLLISGGMLGMVEVLLIVMAVLALSGLLERSGVLKPLLSRPVAGARTRGELIFMTGALGSLLTVVTCDQIAGIVLPARFFGSKFRELGVPPQVLARTISDNSTIIAPLMPWNVNGIIIGTVTGITALEYAPFAVLCYLFPLAALIIYGLEKFRPGSVRQKAAE